MRNGFFDKIVALDVQVGFKNFNGKDLLFSSIHLKRNKIVIDDWQVYFLLLTNEYIAYNLSLDNCNKHDFFDDPFLQYYVKNCFEGEGILNAILSFLMLDIPEKNKEWFIKSALHIVPEKCKESLYETLPYGTGFSKCETTMEYLQKNHVALYEWVLFCYFDYLSNESK